MFDLRSDGSLDFKPPEAFTFDGPNIYCTKMDAMAKDICYIFPGIITPGRLTMDPLKIEKIFSLKIQSSRS